MSASEVRVTIADGRLRFVYDDALLPLIEAGDAVVRRVSHVEPVDGGGWRVDMTPIGGPVLETTFALRADALEMERVWLRAHRGL